MTSVQALLASRQEVTLPFHPKAVLNGAQGNRWARARERRMIRSLVVVLARGLRPMPGRVRVTVEWQTRVLRRMDADNLLARCKPIWDGLVDCGVLDDDDLTVIGVPAISVVKSDGNRVRVVLEPASDLADGMIQRMLSGER